MRTLDPIYARVIARDPGQWFDTFSVNRGTNDGVSVGMAVVTGDGLVGRVYEAGLNYAKVLTIIDSRSAVSCLIERTRDNGVMRGQITATSESAECYVSYVQNIANIVPGDTLITSGTDSLYPKGHYGRHRHGGQPRHGHRRQLRHRHAQRGFPAHRGSADPAHRGGDGSRNRACPW